MRANEDLFLCVSCLVTTCSIPIIDVIVDIPESSIFFLLDYTESGDTTFLAPLS